MQLLKQITTTNKHKRVQTTANHQKTTTNYQQTSAKHQPTTTNHQQVTTNHQQTTTHYQQTTLNGHTCTSNQKADVLLLLPAFGNYKDYLEFEKHILSVRGNWLLLSQCDQNRIFLFWQA